MLLCARDQYGRFLADDGKLRFRRGLVGDQAVDLLPVANWMTASSRNLLPSQSTMLFFAHWTIAVLISASL